MIPIGNTSEEFAGQDYHDVIRTLEEKGFTNVSLSEKVTGWAKAETVVKVIIGDSVSYANDSLFLPGASIIVEYSSTGRDDVSLVVGQWRGQDVESLTSSLEQAGFNNVTPREKITNNLSVADWTVSGLTINYEPYSEGGCFIPRNAPIAIDYYRVKITIGNRLGNFMADKKMKYKSVVEDLQKMGFTNIHLYRNNDLTTGWVDSEGSIAAFYIDGKKRTGFDDDESFYRDVPIEIVVNTFKKNSCDEITDYRKK